MAKTESLSTLQKGDKAPDFSLHGIDRAPHTLAEFSGTKGLFVLFMCNHCPYVKARIAEVVALHKEFGDDITFVAINSNDPDYPGESLDDSITFVKEREVDFAYLLDEDGAIAKKYGATCTPDPFLFDSNFKLVFHGRLVDALEPQEPVTERTMRLAMQKLIKGEEIDPWFNPSLGCSIKFKGQ